MANLLYSERVLRLPRVAWSAVFAGTVVALAIYLVLSALGTAIGSSTVDPLREANPLQGFAFAAGAAVVVVTVISLIAGAYLAGRFAPTHGWLHGVLTWSVMTLITTYLLAMLAGSAVSTAASVLGKGVSVLGEGVARAAPAVAGEAKNAMQQQGVRFDYAGLRSQLDTLLQQTGKPELQPATLKNQAEKAAKGGKAAVQQSAEQPQQAGETLQQWFARVKRSAQPAISAADKQALVNIIAARTGKSQAEAQQIADNYEQMYRKAVADYQAAKQQAEQKAREAAEIAAKNLARASWWTFALLVIGAIVSGAAGNLGFRQQPELEEEIVRR